MAGVRQIGLMTAGCQPWNMDVCAANGDRFAYCSTLAIYIYEMVPQPSFRRRDFTLRSIMSEHTKTITAIAWSPRDPDLIVTTGSDCKVILWNASTQSVVAQLDNISPAPCSVGWMGGDSESTNVCIAFIAGRGPMQLWSVSILTPCVDTYLVRKGSDVSAGKLGAGSKGVGSKGVGTKGVGNQSVVTQHQTVRNFSSDVCQLRFHSDHAERLALGHKNGSLSIFIPGRKPNKHGVQLSEDGVDSDADNHVTSLEWDPLSFDCLLASTKHGGVSLVEANRAEVIMRFRLPSQCASTRALSWVHTAPGMFVTGDAGHGVLRLWNVSQSTPIETIKLKSTGFHAIHVISTAPGYSSIKSPASTTMTDEGVTPHDSPLHPNQESLDERGERREAGVSGVNSGAAIQADILCTFIDGGVGVYDMRRRRWTFLRDQSHIETIFDCEFHPEDPNMLATASFDGTVKVWNISTMKPLHSSTGNEGVLYCISWGPPDTYCIAVATAKRGAFVWDMKKEKVVKRYQEHAADARIFSIAWNQKDGQHIATGSSDNFCIVRSYGSNGSGPDNKVIKYRHPAPVYGCDWSPHSADMLATGCEDSNVRIFYLLARGEQPMKTFSGHTKKVFNVKWSPLREGFIVSGSDDCTVRMWDYTQEGCIRIFTGHTQPVRGLCWNPEVPYLLMTGGWDASIRVWDTRDGACLDTMLDHGADVYGLTCHAQRPFVLASCSRDSTLRLWSLKSLVEPLELNVLAARTWDNIIISPDHAMSFGTPALLAGRVSREIKLQIERLPRQEMRPKVVEAFSKFFGNPEGCHNLWEIIAVICGRETSSLSAEYANGIVHANHVLHVQASRAQQLEMVRWSKFGAGLGAPSREDQLRDAATIHIRLGNVQKYCEALVELGEWDKALAIAPSVSMTYWRALAQRRAKILIGRDSDDAIGYCVATGNAEGLVKFFHERGQLQDAVLVATAFYEGNIAAPPGEWMRRDQRQSVCENMHGRVEDETTVTTKPACGSLLDEASDYLAEWYFNNGSPILAACCHLAINNPRKAMSVLIRGCEVELAASVGLVLCSVSQPHDTSPTLRSSVSDQLDASLTLLARRCERIGCWSLGVDLLKMMSGSVETRETELVKLCARCAASMSEIDLIHEMAGFATMEECKRIADDLDVQDKNRIKFYLLSTEPHIGLDLGLAKVKSVLKRPAWTVDDVWDTLQLISCIQTEKLQKSTELLSQLLVVAAYCGALRAIKKRYNTIIQPLFKHILHLLDRDQPDVPLFADIITSEMNSWLIHNDRNSSLASEHRAHRRKRRDVGFSSDGKSDSTSRRFSASYDEDDDDNVYNKLLSKAGISIHTETGSDVPGRSRSKSKGGAGSCGLDARTGTELFWGGVEENDGPICCAGSHLPSHSDVNISVLNGGRIQGPCFFLEDGQSAMSYNDAVMWAKDEANIQCGFLPCSLLMLISFKYFIQDRAAHHNLIELRQMSIETVKSNAGIHQQQIRDLTLKRRLAGLRPAQLIAA